jgi:UDPglucose 6-dehydrogenase
LDKNAKITVVGSGYVGMSIAALLADKNKLTILDIDIDRVNKINSNQSTIEDALIDKLFLNNNLCIKATIDEEDAYKEAEFIIIATPTDYCANKMSFDTSSVDNVVSRAIKVNKEALIVIKSTIPIGHTDYLQSRFKTDRIIFSPEFLREGNALKDNLYPSRIIVGGQCSKSKKFAKILSDSAKEKDVKILHMPSKEAESVKLFSNTYLAMRVSFFNELDSFALHNQLNTKDIIDGVSFDKRIGDTYNNPSLGYGGYCLPKDTKQLLHNFKDTPQNLIEAIVHSNETRKTFLSNQIFKEKPETIGFYKLEMKKGSDNYRSAAVIDIIKNIKKMAREVIVFEPTIKENSFMGVEVVNNLSEFKQRSEVIVANRISEDLLDVKKKVFSRDIYQEN